MKPAVKVCGVCDAAFAGAAARRGVIFAAKSPRRVTPAAAAEIARAARRGGRARVVGVFVEQPAEEIVRIMRGAGLDVVQLHRRASADDVAALRAAGFEVWTLAGGAPGDGVLFDSSHGDGETEFRRGPYRAIVAGGVSAANVSGVLELGPDVIDVNSSLETAPGVKSAALLDAFLESMRSRILV